MNAAAPGDAAMVDEALVGEAMHDGIDRIVRAAWSILEATPPDLAGELLEAGITLTGGGALIPGLAGEIGVAHERADDGCRRSPRMRRTRRRRDSCVTGLLERLRPHADRLTRWYQSLRIGMRESYSR